jgi:acetyl esterase
MSLDPEVKTMLASASAQGLPPIFSLSPAEARQRIRNAFITEDKPIPVYKVENFLIPCPDHNLPLRVYHPDSDKNRPCLLFFHGGGWTVSDLDTHDALCRSLTNDVGCVVVAVDFRRAPEHKFPAAIDDSYTALEWIERNSDKIGIDRGKIAVGGDSTGGNQAAVVALLSRERNGPKIRFQWLAYPVTDYPSPSRPSLTEMGSGYALSAELLQWFWNNYLPDNTDQKNPHFSPLQAKDLRGLPPAFIMTANYDPLRDEGEAFAERLSKAGVSVKAKRYISMTHGFLLLKDRINGAGEAYREAVKELKGLFKGGPVQI